MNLLQSSKSTASIDRSESRSGEFAPAQTASCRIVIVDDNREAAESLAMLLTVQGHTTHVAYGAKEALERLVDFRPYVGLLDIGLPEMSGYELALAMRHRQEQPGLRLIALTGYASQPHPVDENERKAVITEARCARLGRINTIRSAVIFRSDGF